MPYKPTSLSKAARYSLASQKPRFSLSACAWSSEVTVTSVSLPSCVCRIVKQTNVSLAVFSILALPWVLGGWAFFCCSSSPIRSRGRFPVGLGSSNKMPCHTNYRPSHAIVQLHAAHHNELHCQASILARKRLRSSDKACAPHLLHSAAAHHSTAASWATVMDAHSEIPTSRNTGEVFGI